MNINIKKTKAMVVSKKPNSPKVNITIDGQQIEEVTSIMYLGSLITEEEEEEEDCLLWQLNGKNGMCVVNLAQ